MRHKSKKISNTKNPGLENRPERHISPHPTHSTRIRKGYTLSTGGATGIGSQATAARLTNTTGRTERLNRRKTTRHRG